ncbi:MAG: 5-formyltetrahydrofolate cyclo-ligase, partial [Alphaproteobacteria bacterium]|nr:5-formyltetrahydrofolate cyclo-ligase [Alphaproteobacteria bacterium]
MTLTEQKRALRLLMIDRRAALGDSARLAAAQALLATFRREAPFARQGVVSGFWPIKEEIDIRPLMQELAQAGCRLALPVVEGKGQP